MPNAYDYRAAALRLRQTSVDVLHHGRTLRATPDPAELAGGPFRTVIEQMLDTVELAATRAADELDRLASVCDRRAEICAAHAAALARYRLAATSASPAPPDPPAWWVET